MMTTAQQIDELTNSNQLNPRTKELYLALATLLYHVVRMSSGTVNEFVYLFNLFNKPEVLEQLDSLCQNKSTTLPH